MPEFLVELSTIDNEVSEVIWCEADDRTSAIDIAFGTRNIASSWMVTDIHPGNEKKEKIEIEFDLWQRTRFIRERRK